LKVLAFILRCIIEDALAFCVNYYVTIDQENEPVSWKSLWSKRVGTLWVCRL